ncbi:homoserine kinase [Virgibacillus kimchii]
MSSFRITVPASSANIGPAFDSAGLALNLYLTLRVTEADKWGFEHLSPLLPDPAPYETHFIYQIAKKIADQHDKQLPPCNVQMESDIPLARGLGSSASAVVSGIELANQLCSLHLTAEQKLQAATEIEGHPDNVAPALFGGFIISATTDGRNVHPVRLTALDTDLILYIPKVELKTEAAREVLPKDYAKEEAVSASSISNVMIAALLTGDYGLAGKMMENDLFHEPYRSVLIPNYAEIREEAREQGAYGTVISGAGPSLISFVPGGQGTDMANRLQTLFKEHQVLALRLDKYGVQVS